jgi:hypothetical protein
MRASAACERHACALCLANLCPAGVNDEGVHAKRDAASIRFRALLEEKKSPVPSSLRSTMYLHIAPGIRESHVEHTRRQAGRASVPMHSITSNRKKKRSSPGCPRVSLPSSPSCTVDSSGYLPGGDGDRWRYVPAVCGAGDDDSSHRMAQGMCTRKVLALAGRDAVNFRRRSVAALSARTFIMSSPARRRGSARRGQPLTTARSRGRPSPARPFAIGLFQGLPKFR